MFLIIEAAEDGWKVVSGAGIFMNLSLYFGTVLSSATVVELSARRSKKVLSSVSVGIAT